MIARLKAAARRHEPSLVEDVLGVVALFALLFVTLAVPAVV